MRPAVGHSMLRFNVNARRNAILTGGTIGALLGGSVWGLTHKTVGWGGVIFPLVGIFAGIGAVTAR